MSAPQDPHVPDIQHDGDEDDPERRIETIWLTCSCGWDESKGDQDWAAHIPRQDEPGLREAGHAPMPPPGGDLRIEYRASEVIALGNRRYDEGWAAALPAEPQPPIDVERLALAITNVEDAGVRSGRWDRLTTADNGVLARDLAAEYAALVPADGGK